MGKVGGKSLSVYRYGPLYIYIEKRAARNLSQRRRRRQSQLKARTGGQIGMWMGVAIVVLSFWSCWLNLGG